MKKALVLQKYNYSSLINQQIFHSVDLGTGRIYSTHIPKLSNDHNLWLWPLSWLDLPLTTISECRGSRNWITTFHVRFCIFNAPLESYAFSSLNASSFHKYKSYSRQFLFLHQSSVLHLITFLFTGQITLLVKGQRVYVLSIVIHVTSTLTPAEAAIDSGCPHK